MEMAITGLAAAALIGCEQEGASGAAAQRQMHPVAVGVMKLHRQDVDIESTWFGSLRGVDQADIRPEVSGRLVRQVYQDGSPCTKGEVLFEIDPSTYQAAVDQAQATVAAAEAGVLQAQAANERARLDVERYSELVAGGSISEKNYTDAQQTKRETEAALALAEAQVKQARAALELAQINLDRCVIRAPFAGLASKSTVSIGELISASGPALTSMSSVDPIRVDFAVPAKQVFASDLNPTYDMSTGVMTSAVKEFELILEDGSVFEQRGRVAAVDSEVSRATGTVNFVGHVPNPELRLRAGVAVRVRAVTGKIEDALLVPSRSIVSAMNHRFVYFVNPADKTPIGVDVKLGPEVVLPMVNGDGQTVPMLMQVVTGRVKPIADSLKDSGIAEPAEADVIVEGGQMAAMYANANANMRLAGAKAGFGTVVPKPFIYTAPETTTPSVTAKK